MTVVEAVAWVLALSVADGIDLSAEQADALRPGTTATHRHYVVQLLQQLLQLLLHRHVDAVVRIQHAVNWVGQVEVKLPAQVYGTK